jgi:hypothetical protein
MEETLTIYAVELSGRTHEISGLKSTDTVKDLYTAVNKVLEHTSNSSVDYSLVADDTILGIRDHLKALHSVGITHGTCLPLVRNAESEIFEFSGDIGDEPAQIQSAKNIARLCLIDDRRCVLIRETYTQGYTNAFVWDICFGTYIMDGQGNIDCTWEVKHRRRRSGLQCGGSFSILDSGWIAKENVPEALTKISLANGLWAIKTAKFQDESTSTILGIKLRGRGVCAEALKLMALSS